MNLDMETGIALIKSISGANGVIAAKTAAQVAQAAAEAAQGKAETAQTAAETAQGLAEAAQTAAETAQGAAEDVLESIPQDYSDLSDDVSNLKSQINAISLQNKFDPTTIVSGKYLNVDGSESTRTGAAYSALIPITAEQCLIRFDIASLQNPFYFSVHGYDANGDWSSLLLREYCIPTTHTETKIVTIPSGVSFIRLSWYYYTSVISNVVVTESIYGVTAVDKDARRLKTSIDAGVKTVVSDKIEQQTTYARADLTAGVIYPDGTATSGGSAGYTAPFEVNAGDVITVKKYYVDSRGVLAGEVNGVFGSYVFYDDNTFTAKGWGVGWNANASSITIPEGVHYIQVTINAIMTGTYEVAIVTRTKPNGETNYYIQQNSFKAPNRYSGALSANTYQAIGGRICVDNYILSAAISVGDGFTSFKVGGRNAADSAVVAPSIEVTPTQVLIKSNTSSLWDITESHQLTITDDLQVIVMQSKGSLTAKVIIQSCGSSYTIESARLGAIDYGWATITADGASYADIAYSIRDLFKPVWVCGDSWVTLYDERWYGQAVTLGINGFLHSGNAGQQTSKGLDQLKTLLEMYTPKMIVWLYGMNDEDTDSNTPNASWLAALNELKTICSNKAIELVLATIPTTPTRNNNAKNAVVTTSGYRYVDEVAAMGADDAGNWITGYQSSDGNHTTVAGAKALLARVLADVPELGIL